MTRREHWYQIHLSTAIVLMIVAGILLWANSTKTPVARIHSASERVDQIWLDSIWLDSRPDGRWANGFGWPFGFYAYEEQSSIDWFNWRALGADFILALVVLRLTAVFCEWLIRSRERSDTSS